MFADFLNGQIVMVEPDHFVEVQGTGENDTFDRPQLDALLDLATGSAPALFQAQRTALGR